MKNFLYKKFIVITITLMLITSSCFIYNRYTDKKIYYIKNKICSIPKGTPKAELEKILKQYIGNNFFYKNYPELKYESYRINIVYKKCSLSALNFLAEIQIKEEKVFLVKCSLFRDF